MRVIPQTSGVTPKRWNQQLRAGVSWNDKQTSWSRKENILCDSLSTAEGSLKHAAIGKRKRAREREWCGGGAVGVVGRRSIFACGPPENERGGCASRVSSRANCNLHSLATQSVSFFSDSRGLWPFDFGEADDSRCKSQICGWPFAARR